MNAEIAVVRQSLPAAERPANAVTQTGGIVTVHG
jgi:hypothetical protein